MHSGRKRAIAGDRGNFAYPQYLLASPALGTQVRSRPGRDVYSSAASLNGIGMQNNRAYSAQLFL